MSNVIHGIMVNLGGTNADHDVGILTTDLSVSGTNTTVRCIVPAGEQVAIDAAGTNVDLYVGGQGSIVLAIAGTNATAKIAEEIDLTITKSGTNISVVREPIADSELPNLDDDNAITADRNSVNTTSNADITAGLDDLTEGTTHSTDGDSKTDSIERIDSAISEDTDVETAIFTTGNDSGTDTQIYEGDDNINNSTDVYTPTDDKGSEKNSDHDIANCPSCQNDLDRYNAPTYCPNCGNKVK